MTNEAALRDRLAHPVDFTVADTAGIEKGTLLALLDPRIASGAKLTDTQWAGIAAREKVALDGRTQLAVFQKGIFDMFASGAVTIGAPVTGSGTPNMVQVAHAEASGANIIGHALEAADMSETFQVKLSIGG